MEKTSNKIKQLRISKNLTQQQLADQLHVTKQAISKWEKGKSVPDIASIENLSAFFGVSTDYLINDSIETTDSETTATLPERAKLSKYMNRLSAALMSALAVTLAAIIALSIALGVVVSDGKSDKPVEVHGIVITYLSDKTMSGLHIGRQFRFDMSFNIYNPGDDAKKIYRSSFTINNSQVFYDMIVYATPSWHYSTSEYSLKGHEEVKVVIELQSSRGDFKKLDKHSVTIKYAGQALGTVRWL